MKLIMLGAGCGFVGSVVKGQVDAHWPTALGGFAGYLGAAVGGALGGLILHLV